MSCSTLEEILKSCDNNSGGIYTLLINQQDNITGITTNETGTNWEVTAITHTAPYVALEFKRNTGSFTEDGTIDLVNGSSYAEALIALILLVTLYFPHDPEACNVTVYNLLPVV